MRSTEILDEKTTREIGQIAAENGCRLLAIETAGAGRHLVLRLVLDKEEGVTLEDCEKVSRDVSPLLDAEAPIGHRYHLEVSSPGLDRKLYSPDDARRFVGRRVKVQSILPVEGSRNFRGILDSVEGDRLRIVDEDSRKTYNLSFGEVKVARLEPEWPAATGKRSS
ncbi:MAG TPA: ribosome maturation factor RimP [Thermoanaerobaculia bacterium]|nr:ribosome maturation factor RimP [Thermoanaerobaculia bacterium]